MASTLEFLPEQMEISKIDENTKYFIFSYLDPEKTWEDPNEPIVLKFRDKWQNIMQWKFRDVDWEAIFDHVRAMNYKDFLKTPYWKVVAHKKRIEVKYQCQTCGKRGEMNVHHTSYEFHGNELFNLDLLEVHCRDCHKKIHEIQ